jgi:hypothetical protein
MSVRCECMSEGVSCLLEETTAQSCVQMYKSNRRLLHNVGLK